MNDQKLIKKIINLAYYDFNNNFTNWLSIAGLQAITISMLFCGLCFVTSNYTVGYWGWAPNIIFDWTSKLYNLLLNVHADLIGDFFGIIMLISIIMLPLIIIQNALDLAFDSAMSGFSVIGPVFTYVGAMALSNVILFVFMQLISCLAIFIMLYVMQTSLTFNAFVLKCCMLIMSCFVAYFMQLTYFLSMHILEYKKGIWQSCKELYCMITGKRLFLWKILFIQLFIIMCVFTLLYLCLGTVITVIMPFVMWFLNVLNLNIQPVFIQMMYNFFYLWAYVLLYAWVCLVFAHVYRQLICPPVENASCSSCQSCEK